MASALTIFQMKGITKENFIKIFEGYEKTIDTLDKLGIDLKASVNEFDILKTDLIFFEFQHDFKKSEKIRGELIEYPRSFKAKFWVYFKNNKNYIFASGDKEAFTFIIAEIKKIIADEKFNEIVIEKIKISSKELILISHEDAYVINSSWFRKLDEDVKSVYIGGHLEDEDNINELYKQVKEKAGDITSISFTSEKLGYNVTISRKKGSIFAKARDATPESLIGYFAKVIEKKLDVA